MPDLSEALGGQGGPPPACPACGDIRWAPGAWERFFAGETCASFDESDTTFCRARAAVKREE
jgi:hypothetical protein